MLIVTIDSGTTNTRVRAWENNVVLAQHCENVGVRDTAITKSTDKLMHAVKTSLSHVLQAVAEKTHISDPKPAFIIASGMITSNMGLHEIPHLSAPVSTNKLASAMVSKVLPELSDEPIWFVSGIKNSISNIDLDNCEQMDMMRGEEVEVIGVLKQLKLNGPALIVLPGSHSKFVKIDSENRIEGCCTTIAGELLDTITQHTLLTNALSGQFADNIDEPYLLKGADYCRQVGLARSCFSVRILDIFTQLTTNQKANFLLGIVLYSDLVALKSSQALHFQPNITIVICGKKILRQALSALIHHDTDFNGDVILVEEENYPPLSGVGAMALINIINNKEKT